MKTRRLAQLAVLASPALLGPGAAADLTGVVATSFEVDIMDQHIPAFGPAQVIRLYAAFDEPGDRLYAVFGNASFPLSITPAPEGDFYQHPLGGDCADAQSPTLIALFPELAYDSYLDIGSMDTFSNFVGFSPGFPPTGWGIGGLQTTSGSWQRQPTDPLTIADANGLVIIAQITIEANRRLTGLINLTTADDDGNQTTHFGVTFEVGACLGDSNGDGTVNVDDLNNVILDWGADGSAHGGDVAGAVPGEPPDGIVDVNDLNAVIVNWGPCDFLGACCLEDAQCLVLLPDACTDMGGEPLESGTSCLGACSTVQRCCLPDGSCVNLASDVCEDEGGTTAVGPCQTPRACCLDGVCTDLDAFCCITLGGYIGPGPCVETAVACCLPDGTCVVTPASCCEQQGGVSQGSETDCVDVGDDCPTTQRCCLPEGCLTIPDDECLAMGGTSVTGNCEPPQACILPDDSCMNLDVSCCLLAGGTPQPTQCVTRCSYEVDMVEFEGGCTECPIRIGDTLCLAECDAPGECLAVALLGTNCDTGTCTGTATFQGCDPCSGKAEGQVLVGTVSVRTPQGAVSADVYRPQ